MQFYCFFLKRLNQIRIQVFCIRDVTLKDQKSVTMRKSSLDRLYPHYLPKNCKSNLNLLFGCLVKYLYQTPLAI